MDRVSVLPNQRIGISDFEAGAGGRLIQEDQLREGQVFLLTPGKATGYSGSQARIIGGFDLNAVTLGVDSTMTLNRGRAILPLISDANQLAFGLMFGYEGVASLIVDFATASPSADQDVYIRAVTTQATFANRVFWNPSGAPAREFVANVSTRKVVGWEATFRTMGATAPGGGEWVKIYVISIDGSGKISAINDVRHNYFEGDSESGSFGHEWGDGSNDRSADRGSYGVKDLHEFVQLVRRQLSDIIDPVVTSAPHHHEAVTVGLKQLDDEHKTDGEHGAINADSVSTSGRVTIGTDLSVSGVVDATLDVDADLSVRDVLTAEDKIVADQIEQSVSTGTMDIGHLATGTIQIVGEFTNISAGNDATLEADDDVIITADKNVGGAGDVLITGQSIKQTLTDPYTETITVPLIGAIPDLGNNSYFSVSGGQQAWGFPASSYGGVIFGDLPHDCTLNYIEVQARVSGNSGTGNGYFSVIRATFGQFTHTTMGSRTISAPIQGSHTWRIPSSGNLSNNTGIQRGYTGDCILIDISNFFGGGDFLSIYLLVRANVTYSKLSPWPAQT